MSIHRCPQISLSSIPKVEEIEIENTETVALPTRFNLQTLKKLTITGRKKPIKYDQEIGTTVTIAEGKLGSRSNKPEVTLTNCRINKIAKQMNLKKLKVESSLFPDTEQKIFQNIDSANIDELEIENSDILSIFKLGLSRYSQPFTFSDNQIHSSCQTGGDDQNCFLQPHGSSVYEHNRIQCGCSTYDGDECVTRDKGFYFFPDI